MRKRSMVTAILICLLIFNGILAIAAEDDSRGKLENVLIIHSYSRDYIWTENQHDSIVKSLENYSDDIRIRVEYMDTKNYISDEIMETLHDLYAEKYRNNRFDVIIATDNNAFDFLARYRDELFPNTKVVVSGVNYVESLVIPDNFHLIAEKVDYRSTIDLALEQNEGAGKIYIVTDRTNTGKLVEGELKHILNSYEEIDDFEFLYDLEKENVQDKISKLTDQDILIYLFYFRDSSMREYKYYENSKLVSEIANIPVYTFWDFNIGNGILGGKLLNSSEYGRVAVEKAIDLAEGRSVEKIIYSNGKLSRYMYDYLVAKEYKIDDFPEGSLVVNKPVSYYEKHRGVIILFAITTLILTIIIVLLIRVLKDKNRIEEKNRKIISLDRELISTQSHLITTLGEVIETKSQGMANHVKRVAKISAVLAKEYGLSDDEVNLIELVSPMHDVGKIGISEGILQKTEKLTEEEFETMKYHTNIGYDILHHPDKNVLNLASKIALQHHERWDGLGYPNSLKEEEIHIFARITSVADVYDALRSTRPYKKEWTKECVIEFFKKQKGIMFDPKIVEIFLNNIDEIEEIRRNYSDQSSKK